MSPHDTLCARHMVTVSQPVLPRALQLKLRSLLISGQQEETGAPNEDSNDNDINNRLELINCVVPFLGNEILLDVITSSSHVIRNDWNFQTMMDHLFRCKSNLCYVKLYWWYRCCGRALCHMSSVCYWVLFMPLCGWQLQIKHENIELHSRILSLAKIVLQMELNIGSRPRRPEVCKHIMCPRNHYQFSGSVYDTGPYRTINVLLLLLLD